MKAAQPGSRPGLVRALPLVLLVLSESEVRHTAAATSLVGSAAGMVSGCNSMHFSSGAPVLSLAAQQPGVACVADKHQAPPPLEGAGPQVTAQSAPMTGTGLPGGATSGTASPEGVVAGDGFGNQPTVVRQGLAPPGGFSSETEWPQLVGTNATAAKDKLTAETGLRIVLVPEGSVVTDDYRENRIRIWFDPDTMLVITPYPAIG